MSDQEDCNCPKPKKGSPAWMATFADLSTLLMCFFVLLLSFSEMDAMKFKRLAGSMAQAFGVQNKLNVNDIPKGTSIIAQEFSPGIPEPTPINEIWQKTEDITEMTLDFEDTQEFDVEQGDEDLEAGVRARIEAEIEELIKQTQRDAMDLANALHDQIVSGQVEVETRGRKIIIRIREKGSFASGSADLNPDYQPVLAEVRDVLRTKTGAIQVQGHTDNVPINTERFRSNWELSAGRAVSVAHELLRGEALAEDRFQVMGYADTQPLESNDSAEGRARNRRVEIVIQQGLGQEMKDDLEQLNGDEADVLKTLELDPDYLFELKPEEIF